MVTTNDGHVSRKDKNDWVKKNAWTIKWRIQEMEADQRK